MAALGFGFEFLAAEEAGCAFVASALCGPRTAAGLSADTGCFVTSLLAATPLAGVGADFFALGFGAGFFVAAFGSSFFSVNSNAGFGTKGSCGLMRVFSAAGFTPAAAAALTAEAESMAGRVFPS